LDQSLFFTLFCAMNADQPKRYGVPRYAPPPKRQKQAQVAEFDPAVHLAPLLALAPRQDRLETLQREAECVSQSLPSLSLRVAQLRWRAVLAGSGVQRDDPSSPDAPAAEGGEEERLARLLDRLAALESA